jgi:WD40 repeat protein
MKPWLLSGSADGTVILWDYRRGTLLHRFYAHPTGVCHLLQPPPSTYAQLVADETNRGENINRSARPHAAISTKQKLFVKRSQPSSREGSASSLNSAESVMLSEKVDGNHEIQIMPLERLLMLVFSVGADNSVTLLNLEELTAPITLGSHPPIAALDFYTNGTVTVRCKHNTDSYEYFCWYIGVGLAQLESQSTSLSTNQFGRIVCTL